MPTRLWYNNAEGGTNGATPTVTDTGSGHPHSAISIGASNTAVYSTTTPLLGTKSILATQASANQLIFGVSSADPDSVEWTSSKGHFCVDFFFRFSAAPAVTSTLFRGYSDTGYATQIFGVSLTTTRRVSMSNTVGGQSVSTPSGVEVLAVNTPYLLRFSSNAAAGTMELYVYPLGNDQVYTQATLTGLSQASIASFRYGITTASSNFALTSELQLSADGFLNRLDIPNVAPTVSLGDDVAGIEPYADITVTATGSDADGASTIVSYNVYQKTGPTVTLTGAADSAIRGYKSPGTLAGTVLTFGATCTDNFGAVSPEDVVSHTVLPVDRGVYVGGVLVPYEQSAL